MSVVRTRLEVGSIILFDELTGYSNWALGEYKALEETLPEDCCEYIGFGQMQAALRSVKAP